MELRAKITTFKNTDMIEMLKFRNQIESLLEKLTDESQVSPTTMSINMIQCIGFIIYGTWTIVLQFAGLEEV